MASNLIFRKQRYSGRRRSYIYSTWQCRIAISSTLIWGLCRQCYSFALATPGDTPSVNVVDVGSLGPQAPVSPLCFAAHAVKHCVMHAPGYAAASATLGPQWHKAMPGQSHHGNSSTNSYKGRHKQRNRSKRFPIYRLRSPTRLHRNQIGDVTHKNSPGRNTTGRTRRVSFRLSRCGANTWLHRPHTGSLWSGGFGLCRWLSTGNLTSSGNTSVPWIHFY